MVLQAPVTQCLVGFPPQTCKELWDVMWEQEREELMSLLCQNRPGVFWSLWAHHRHLLAPLQLVTVRNAKTVSLKRADEETPSRHGGL